MSLVARLWFFIALFSFAVGAVYITFVEISSAFRIREYSDLISDSGPSFEANHTFSFLIDTDLTGGSTLEFTWPSGFTVPAPTSTFNIRNVELAVNGTNRNATATPSVGVDGVSIFPGDGGSIYYTLAPDGFISSGSQLTFKVGNQTSGSLQPVTSFATSTGTTTSSGDLEPIINTSDTGTHRIVMEAYDGGLVASTEFLIAIVEKVAVPNVDTTEEIPPFRFNGSPTSTVGGTTQSVELTLETDEFAICRYSATSSIPFSSMPNTFPNTGLVFHSGAIIPVTPDTNYAFYVRCIDDEGNFNTDDYVISFYVNPTPEGDPNTDGNTQGDGSGTGNGETGEGEDGSDGGSGGGSGGGGGSSSGGGGSGGGGGGGSGSNSGNQGSGGFEATDDAYESGDGRVIISGYAFPGARVFTLVDGNGVEEVRASNDGRYSVTLDEIARGVYTFGVYAVDDNNIRSSTFSTSFTVSGARTTNLSNVNVMPSIEVDPDPVDPGQTLTVRGYALPNAAITIENGPQRSSIIRTIETTSDADGEWSITLDTGNFRQGTYQVRARAEQSGENARSTSFSDYTYYGVGEEADVPLDTDLNRDGRVNLTDFSILLFWWNSNGGDSDPPADINRDGRVNLTDFSILLFNWTG